MWGMVWGPNMALMMPKLDNFQVGKVLYRFWEKFPHGAQSFLGASRSNWKNNNDWVRDFHFSASWGTNSGAPKTSLTSGDYGIEKLKRDPLLDPYYAERLKADGNFSSVRRHVSSNIEPHFNAGESWSKNYTLEQVLKTLVNLHNSTTYFIRTALSLFSSKYVSKCFVLIC